MWITARDGEQSVSAAKARLKPLLREAVQVRRLMQFRAVAAEVAPAEIVGEDEDDVRLGFSGVKCGHRCQQQSGE